MTLKAFVEKGRMWPLAVVGWLLFIMALNITVLVVAEKTKPVLVDQRPYEEGLKYQGVINALQVPSSLGWKVNLKTDYSVESGEGTLGLSLHDRDGAALTNARVVLSAMRPSDAGQDQKLELIEQTSAPGTYVTKLSGPKGLWYLKFNIVLTGVEAQIEDKVVF